MRIYRCDRDQARLSRGLERDLSMVNYGSIGRAGFSDSANPISKNHSRPDVLAGPDDAGPAAQRRSRGSDGDRERLGGGGP